MPNNLMKTAALLAVLLLTGCEAEPVSYGGVQSPEYYSVRGTWRGTSGNVVLRLDLDQSGNTLSGSGAVRTGTGAAVPPLTATGSNIRNVLEITLTSPGYADVAFTGDVAGRSTIWGRLDESGFDNVSITLTKD